MDFFQIKQKYIYCYNWQLMDAYLSRFAREIIVNKVWRHFTSGKFLGQWDIYIAIPLSIEILNLKTYLTALVSLSFVILGGQPTLLFSNFYVMQPKANVLWYTRLCPSRNSYRRVLWWQGWCLVFGSSMLWTMYWKSSLLKQNRLELDLWQDTKSRYIIPNISKWLGCGLHW